MSREFQGEVQPKVEQQILSVLHDIDNRLAIIADAAVRIADAQAPPKRPKRHVEKTPDEWQRETQES